ncbi:hypothetical protein M758_UG328200 [Ceratodon purpureus]|nr:hypothetical protein M758_UG328200 [Ceratodon purpureus]
MKIQHQEHTNIQLLWRHLQHRHSVSNSLASIAVHKESVGMLDGVQKMSRQSGGEEEALLPDPQNPKGRVSQVAESDYQFVKESFRSVFRIISISETSIPRNNIHLRISKRITASRVRRANEDCETNFSTKQFYEDPDIIDLVFSISKASHHHKTIDNPSNTD